MSSSISVKSCNGWDPLKEVIVGDVTGARIPPLNPSMKNFMFANLTDSEIVSICKPWIYPTRVIEETEEDLDQLAKTLRDLHIHIYRPEKKVYGWMNYCPRDIFLVLNDTIIETPCVMSERVNESFAYRHILNNINSYSKWIQAPTPQHLDMSFNFTDLSKCTLQNIEIMFDAANVIRLGKDLLCQVSNSGNEKGFDWLKHTFPEYTIHLGYHYSGAHFDSTVVPLRPGLVLLNGHRCNEDNYPKIFEKWDKIFFTDIIDQVADDRAISSSAIGINILSVNEHTVIVDKNQKPLIKELKKWGIDSIPLQLRHAKTLGGGFHCVTLDLHREGKLEQYEF